MLGLRRFAFLFGFVVALPLSAETTVIHVAPGGDDRSDGSPSRPLATPAEALRRLREVGGTREVRLAPGEYRLGRTLIFEKEDSGRAGALLKLVGDGAVISGFQPLSTQGWHRITAASDRERISDSALRMRILEYRFGEVQRAQLGRLSRMGFDAGERRETPPAMLYYGGRRMQLARWPNGGELQATEVVDPGPTRYVDGEAAWRAFWNSGGAFKIDSDRPKAWAEPEKAWVEGRFGNAWEWSFNRVADVRGAGREIALAYGEVSGIGADENHAPHFSFVNVLEELDEPGEYYIDPDRGLLFFLPPEGVDDWAKAVSLSWAGEPLLQLLGARHVEISGITFEGGRSHGVVVEDGLDIRLHDISVRHCSGDGMRLSGREMKLERLICEELGGRGMVLEGGDEAKVRTSGNVISDSRFVGVGWWEPAYHPALELVGVGHQVRNCEFSDLPHMAIEVNGSKFRIEGCWFSRTCTELRDMCAIYFNLGGDPQKRGTVIRGNLFQNIGLGLDGARGGVYLDNGTMGVQVLDNVFYRVGSGDDGWAVMNHGGAYIRVENNAFIDCPLPYHLGYWWNTWGKDELPSIRERWKMILEPEEASIYRKRYPELAKFFEEDRVFPESNTFTGNRISNPRVELVTPDGISVFGGPVEKLMRSENTINDVVEGLSFDGRGRPMLPGWRPWKSFDVSRR